MEKIQFNIHNLLKTFCDAYPECEVENLESIFMHFLTEL